MSLFLQTPVLDGILFREQERAVESFSDVEEFHMKPGSCFEFTFLLGARNTRIWCHVLPVSGRVGDLL